METAHLTQLLEFTQVIHAIRNFSELEGVIFGVLRLIEPFDSVLLFIKDKPADQYRLEGMYPSRQYSQVLRKERPVFHEALLFPRGIFSDHVGPTLVAEQAGIPKRQVPFQLLALLHHPEYRKAFYVPIVSGQEKHGLLLLLSRQEGPLPEPRQLLLKVLGLQLGAVLQNICIRLQGAAAGAPAVHGVSDSARAEPSKTSFYGIISSSQKMKCVFEQMSQVAPTDATVLLLGESGTGKELVAHALHQLSPRKGKALVKVNCATLPAHLIESELFGHEKGAFTGAYERRTGKFELAHGGTIFLDEIGELPLELQAKLLRVLQEKEIERLGSNSPIRTDIRIVAATNRDLEGEVREGRFRLDLYYRLNVFPITLPPLRDRKEDIPLLAEHFARKCAKKCARTHRGIDPQALGQLQDYAWPGNIRELENLIEQAVIIHQAPTPLQWGELLVARSKVSLTPVSAPRSAAPNSAASVPNQELESMLAVLQQTRGKVVGKGGAAQILNVKPYKLEEVERIYVLSVLSQTKGRIRGEGGAAEVLGVKPTYPRIPDCQARHQEGARAGDSILMR
jgi:transcriptional regulator with GAF, ATPase, and Fis domain